MRRAKDCFKKEGITVTPYSTDKYAGKRRYDFQHLFIPNVGSFVCWEKLIHEIVGYVEL